MKKYVEPEIDALKFKGYLEDQVVRIERLSYNVDALRQASRGARRLWASFRNKLSREQKARLRQVIRFAEDWTSTGVGFFDYYTPTPMTFHSA